MRTTRCCLVFGIVASCAAAHADYQGLSVEKHTTVNVGGITRDVFRLYAHFSNSGDMLTQVWGSPTLGAMTIESRNADDSGPGSAFYNPAGGSNHAPTQELIDLLPNTQWDSFCTIGVSIADQAPFGDQTLFSPGFPNLAGTVFQSNNAGWVALPTIDHDGDSGSPDIPNPQSQAGFLGDGDPLLRVLALQLTVNSGDHVRGTVIISVRLQGAGFGFNVPGETFSSFPAPGGLAVLALAGLTGAKRRRR